MNDDDNPWLGPQREHDAEIGERDRWRRWLGGAVVVLTLLLGVAIADNAYQRRQVREPPWIDSVDVHGQVVTRPLRRADTIPDQDPLKLLLLQRYINDHIKARQTRMRDEQFLQIGLRTAVRQTAGPAQQALMDEVKQEEPFKRIKTERVEVENVGLPMQISTRTWEAAWKEIVKNQTGMVARTETWKAYFRIVEDPKAVEPGNPFGWKIIESQKHQLE